MEKILKRMAVLAAIAGVLGVISAYGSTCPTLSPPTDPTSKLYIMYTLNWVFLITTSLTWAVGFAWFLLLWGLMTRRSWSYMASVLVSAVGAASGFIPAALVMANGMPFSPSLMRAFLNLFILIYLLRPSAAGEMKTALSLEAPGTGISADVVTYILVAVGILLMLQPIVVPWTHVIDGRYEYGYEALQFFAGLFSLMLGGSIRISERMRLAQLQASAAVEQQTEVRPE